LIAIVVFMMQTTVLVQALTAILVLLWSLYWQYSWKPYINKELNKMDSEALLTATITIYCGIYYISNALPGYIEILMFLGIVLGNAYFVCHWIFYMSKAGIDILVKFYPSLRYFLRKGDAFDEEFYQENIVREGMFIDQAQVRHSYSFFHSRSLELQKKLKVSTMNELYLLAATYEMKQEEKKRVQTSLELISI
jgi:hypothetical protein